MAPLLGVAVFLSVFVSLGSPAATAATTSSNLNFQARLLTNTGAVVPDGNYNIDFKIYTADSTTGSVGTCSGTCVWEETRKNSNSQGVQVINGYFNVNLGSVTAFGSSINWDQQLWLTMNIGGTTTGASPTWDGEMQNGGHSIALTALPYSFVAGQLAKTSGANRGTLSFNTVANNPAITLPDASGTVCLQSSSACGFIQGTGTAFVQNGNSLGATAVFGTTDANGINIITNNHTVQSLSSTGAALFENFSNSATAFQVQDSGSSTYLNINTTDGYVINNGTSTPGNEIQNPSFESSGTTDATGWYTPSGTQVITNSSANAHSGNYEMQVTGNSSTHAIYTKYYAVHPGDTIYTEAWVKNSAGATGDAGIYLEFSDKDKGNATFSNADTGLPGTSYTLKSIQTTIPSGKYFVRLALSVKGTATAGTFYFDDAYLRLGNQQAPLLITNTSSTAFQVQNSSSQTVLGVDASASTIFSSIPDSATAIGFNFKTAALSTAGAKVLSLKNNTTEEFYVDKDGNVWMNGGLTANGDITTTGNANIGSGKVYKINGTQITSAALSNDSNLAKLDSGGANPQIFTGNNKFSGTVLVANNNAAGFQVQHGSVNVLTVDTSGDKVILGTSGASGLTGKAQYNYSGSTGSISITALDPSSTAYTLSLPAETGTFCTSAASSTSNCTNFASATSLTSGLAGKLNKGSVDTSSAAVTAVQGDLYAFTNSSSGIASGVLKLDNGNNTDNALYVTASTDYGSGKAYIVVNNTNGTPAGNLIDLQANASSVFSVDATGNITNSGNINIGSGKQFQIGGTQISSSNLSNDSNIAKLTTGPQTFSNVNTFSSASNSFTGSGSGLTSLNASNVSSGTLNDGRLTSNVALLNRTGQTFTGDNSFAPTGANVGTTIIQTSGTATSGSVLDVQTANGTSHFLQITNAAANEGNVTLQSVGATRDLTLGSGSGTLKITSGTTTIQKPGSSLSIDLQNGADSTLTITNSSTGVASLSVQGDVAIGATRVYKVGSSSGQTVSACSSGQFLGSSAAFSGGILTAGGCQYAVTQTATPTTSYANGANISNNTLTLGLATVSNPGIVSTAGQTFAGNKVFTGDTSVQDTSATAFQVQNTSSRSLFNVDTSGNVVSIGNSTDGSQITLAATGNANGAIRKSMVVNGSISANDLVEIDTANAGQVKQSAASSTKIFGVATSAVGSGSAQDIVIGGVYQVNANSSGGTINVGDTLVSSSTAGQATKAGSTTASGSVIGLALSTVSSGKVWIYINLGLGGSDNLQTVYNKDVGGTTPDIKVSSIGGLEIQDSDTSLNGSILAIRNSNSSGLGSAILDVQSFNPTTDITNNATDNLVTNGSIETGTTGWTKMGSTQVAVAQDPTDKYIGSSSLRIVTNATDTSGTDGASYALTTSTLVSNTQYTLTLSAKTAAGSSMSTFEIGRADNGSTNTSCLTAQTINGSGWKQFTCTFTTGTTSGTPYIYVRQTDQVARTMYIDGIQLFRTSLLSNQFADQTFAAGDWQAKGSATVTRDTTQNQAGAGTASVKVATSTNASNNDGVKHNITLNDSTLYTLSFYALLDSGSSALSTMEAGYSSDGSTDNTVCITGQSVTTTWTQYTCSFTTPSSHSGTPFFYVKELNTTGVKTFYIDNASLSIGNPLGAYSEGKVAISGTITSPVVLQNQTNSTTAFQIQNANGSGLFNVDTTNTSITITAGTVNTTLALGDLAAGSIGTAPSTVDIYTSFTIAPTASGRAYTVPNPTLSTAYGRVIYIGNIGATGNFFTIGGIRIPPGSTATMVWSNTNGGASWNFAGAGGSAIENQNSADQTATFRINGSGTINNSGTTAFQVQDGSANPVFTVNTSGGIIQIGSSTSNTGTQIFALNNNNGTTTPTEVDGAMYYNNSTSQFMCGENGFWVNCGVPPRDHSYDLYDEFMNGMGNASIPTQICTSPCQILPTNTTGIGGLNWYNSLIGTPPSTLQYLYNQTGGNSPTADANRPGILDIQQTGTGNNTGQTMSLGIGSMLLGTSRIDLKTAVNVTGGNLTVLVGMDNETTAVTAPTTGVYFKEASNGAWNYCYVNATPAETCTSTGTNATAGTWYRLEIQIVSSSEIDFYLNGTKFAATGITYNTTNKVSPAFTTYKTSGTPGTLDLYVDYFELLGTTSAAR